MTLALDPTPRPIDRRQAAAWLGAALGALWAIYLLVFLATSNASAGRAAIAAADNVAPLAALALVTRAALARLFARPAWQQALAHLILAATFAIAWYGATVLLLAITGWLAGDGFHLRGFSGPALTWQAFQGLILYSAVAAVCYALRAAPSQPSAAHEVGPAAGQPLERYLIREGEAFRPVDVADIVAIAGAQDYSEVSTAAGRHLVRMSLGEFEARLDPNRFIRVHRSAIIQLAFLERAEAAGGGRMLAHMVDGQAIPISRAGVKALRPLIV